MAVYSFGRGKLGQLGLGHNQDSLEPSIIESLKGKKIKKIVCGEQFSLSLSELGDLFTWGRGKEGQLGNGNRENSSVPRRVEALKHVRLRDVACGPDHCLALTESGDVYTWGKLHRSNRSSRSKLYSYFENAIELPGMKTMEIVDRSISKYFSGTLSEEKSAPSDFGMFEPYFQTTPILMSVLNKKNVKSVCCGYAFSVAMTHSGEVYTWGFNEKGQLGLGHRYNQEMPTKVEILSDQRIIGGACGLQHTAVISENGEVFTWGLGIFGQLGHGILRDELLPRRIETFLDEGLFVIEVAAGSHYTMARTREGQLLTWGHGEYGQHGGRENYNDWGIGAFDAKNSKDKHHFHSIPRLLMGFESKCITHIAAGNIHSIMVTKENEVFTWGWGSSGCLGHGDRRFQLIPKEIINLQGESIVGVAAGHQHTLVLLSDTNSSFAFDFKSLIDSNYGSDLQFEVDGKFLKAHRVIVYARCPQLERMLLIQRRFGHLDDRHCASLKIVDVRYGVFLALLRYLYTDHLKAASHLLDDLEILAKKYQLWRLAVMCKRAKLVRHTPEMQNTIQIPPSTFSEDLRKAVNNNDYYPDGTFTAQSEIIPIHKAILKCRSSYFERFFDSSFKEKDQIVYEIDVSPAIFMDLLIYLYTNEESIIVADNAVELLELADKFMLEDFKQIVEYFIEASLDTDNVAYLLQVADRFGAPRLKRSCLDLMCRSSMENWRSASKTANFAEIATFMPLLLREIDYHASKHELIKPGEAIRLANTVQREMPSTTN